MSARTRSLSRLLVLALGAPLALAVACGAEPEGEAANGSVGGRPEKPSASKIVGAVIRSLLSNQVEARETEAAPEPAGEAPPPAAPSPLESLASESPETCVVPYSGPVTIIPVRSTASIQRAVSGRRQVAVVYETDDTAIFEDGRVLTTDMEQVGTHLNAVGWASNPMKIAGTGQRPGGSSKNLGFGSAITSFKGSSGSLKKTKRRRRRG